MSITDNKSNTVEYVDDGGRWCNWLFDNKQKTLDNMIGIPNGKIDFMIAHQVTLKKKNIKYIQNIGFSVGKGSGYFSCMTRNNDNKNVVRRWLKINNSIMRGIELKYYLSRIINFRVILQNSKNSEWIFDIQPSIDQQKVIQRHYKFPSICTGIQTGSIKKFGIVDIRLFGE